MTPEERRERKRHQAKMRYLQNPNPVERIYSKQKYWEAQADPIKKAELLRKKREWANSKKGSASRSKTYQKFSGKQFVAAVRDAKKLIENGGLGWGLVNRIGLVNPSFIRIDKDGRRYKEKLFEPFPVWDGMPDSPFTDVIPEASV